jgi:hypothetical protein
MPEYRLQAVISSSDEREELDHALAAVGGRALPL